MEETTTITSGGGDNNDVLIGAAGKRHAMGRRARRLLGWLLGCADEIYGGEEIDILFGDAERGTDGEGDTLLRRRRR